MIIKVQVYRDDLTLAKQNSFQDPMDLIGWIVRCYQATRRAHGFVAATRSLLGFTEEEGGAK